MRTSSSIMHLSTIGGLLHLQLFVWLTFVCSMARDATWDDLWDAEPFERVDKLSPRGRLILLRDALPGTLSEVSLSTSRIANTDDRLLWFYHGPHTDKLTRSPKDEELASVQERKRSLLNDPTENLVSKMEQFAEDEMNKLDEQRLLDECWLHPKPALLTQIIAKTLKWRSRDGRIYMLSIHLGLIVLLLANLSDPETFPISKEQKEGFIQDAWNLSHLCGNWTCLNPHHFTLEPGPINVSRNRCFKHSNGCEHSPQCLKSLKRPLSGLRPALFTMEELNRASTLLSDRDTDYSQI